MDDESIEAMLQMLLPQPWGWQAPVPAFMFLGRSIGLRVDTRPFPTDEPPPPPSAVEVMLVRQVLGGLAGLLPGADTAYRQYHGAAASAVELADQPRIWVSREEHARNGFDRWALVVGIAGAEDYGTHLDFAGLTFLGIWSGD